MGPETNVVLKVMEASEADVGKGWARVDAAARSTLDVKEGDVVGIVGKKATAARLHRLTQEDEGKGIVRVDGLVRRNLGVSIGDKVEVRKAEVLPAERVTIAPIISEGHKISFGQGIENFVKRGLLKRPVTKGDVVIVPGIALMGGALPFMVINVVPKGVVQVTEGSIIDLREEAVREHLLDLQNRSSDEIYREFILDLRTRVGSVLDDYAQSLEELPSDMKERIRGLVQTIRNLLTDAESKR